MDTPLWKWSHPGLLLTLLRKGKVLTCQTDTGLQMMVLNPYSCTPFPSHSKDMLIDFASEKENNEKISRECCSNKSQHPLAPRGMARLSGAFWTELPEALISRTDKAGI